MAYYKLSGGKTAPTYESCSTAAFKHGRTETIRSATTATAMACQLFHQPTTSRPSDAQLLAALHECSVKHNQLTKEAAIGLSFVLVKCSLSNLNALEFAGCMCMSLIALETFLVFECSGWLDSVTCHPTKVRIPPLPPSEAGTPFGDPEGMQGWVDLCYVKADRRKLQSVCHSYS